MWVPVQQHHAIERLRLEFGFREALPSKVVETARRIFDPQRATLRFSDPEPQDVHQFILQPGNFGPPATQKVVGWQSTRRKDNVSIAEAVALNPTAFSYESTDYRGWDTAYKRFSKVVRPLLEVIINVVDLNHFSLEYTNRFVFQGQPDRADPSPILSESVLNSINDRAKAGLSLWHLHRGWFEMIEGRNILVNQNIDVQDGQSLDGRPVRSIQIYNRAEFRPEKDQFSLDGIDSVATELHDLLKGQFCAVLSPTAMHMLSISQEA